MSSKTDALHVAMEKRILNEFGAKILNEEKMDKVVKLRGESRLSEFSEMSFQCECDDSGCIETISISTEEYQQVHDKTRNFIVIPSHVHLDLERVLESFHDYVLVGKYFPHPKDL